jgi:signal transduction histidine kinase
MGRLRLHTKFLLAMLAILLGLSSTSLLLVRRTLERHLRAQINQDLRNSVALFRNVERQREFFLRNTAQLVANLPISRALMTTADPATIQDASADLWRLSGADLFLLAGRTGSVFALHGAASGFTANTAEQLLKDSLEGNRSPRWWFAASHLYEVSIQPIYFGPERDENMVGLLVLGSELDERTARELGQVTASQVTFWYGKDLVRSTLSPEQERELGARGPEPGTTQDPIQAQLGPELFLVTSLTLTPAPVAPAVRLTVAKSLREAQAFIGYLDRLVLGLGLLAVVAGSVLVFVVSRTFTRPLGKLVAGVRALSAGDYTYPLQVRGSDEVAELTTAFGRMRTSLYQSQRELLEAERLATIGQMASSISHDLRHHLAAIMANAEFLCDERNAHSRQELYDELRGAVNQMTDVIESLLEFARPRESLRLTGVSLSEVIGRAMQTVRAYPEFSTVEMVLTGDTVEGWFDFNKLARVFQNLLLNSCAAAPEAGGKVEVTIRRLRDSVEVRVADNGRGIPEAMRDKVFDPFVSYGKENGTGLGLTVVQKIVQDHGGEVRVEQTSSSGTVIRLQLPLLSSPHPSAVPDKWPAITRLEPSE